MNIYKHIFRQSAVYSVSLLFTRFSSIFLLRIYTAHLSPRDYGVMELLDLTSYLLIMLVGLRLGDALTYSYFGATDEEHRRSAVSTAYIGAIFVGILIGTAAWFSAVPISEFIFRSAEEAPYFRIVFCTMAVSLPLEVSLAYLRALNNPRRVTQIQVCRTATAIAVTLTLMLGFKFRVTSVLWGAFSSSLLGAVIVGIFLLRHVGTSFHRALFMQQYKYAIPVSIGGAGMLFIHYGDRYFLERNCTLADVGIYALSYKLGMMISYLYEPFAAYWNAQVFAILKTPEGEQTYTRTATYLTLGLTFLALGLSVFAGPILTILTHPEFHGAARLVPLIAMAYVLRGVGDHVRRIFMVENRTGLEMRVSIVAAAVCLTAYVILIPMFKLTGAAVATLVAFVVVGGFGFWQAQRVRKFHFEVRRLVTIFGCAIVTLIANVMLRPPHFWPQVLAGTISLVGFLALLVIAGFPEGDETEAIRYRLVNFRRRLSVAAGS